MIEADLVYSVILFLLATIVLWIYFHHISFFFLSIYTARYSMHRKIGRIAKYPGISIIKPLMGCDSCLRENLVSHFTLDYPQFELLFCVQEEDDPAIDLVKRLLVEFPSVDAQIFVGGYPGVVNPMVANMGPAYLAAKYDRIWVSTSRIKVNTQIMLDLVEKSLDSDVGLVHQSSFFADQPGFLGALDKICFGCSISRNQLALTRLGIVCFVGMSYIVKRSLLEECGGLLHYGKYLAEDFFFSNELHSQGYRVVVSDFPAIQNVVMPSIGAYVTRMVRWLRLRLRMVPLVAVIIEPLSEGVTLGILFAISVNYLFEVPIVYLLLGHFAVWLTLDYVLLISLQNGRLLFSIPTFVLAWFCRELLVYWIYLKAISNPAIIQWGRYSYRVQLGGLTQRLPAKPPAQREYKPVEQMEHEIGDSRTELLALS
ncbi:Ceramide glucosyltransferase-B [Clonorchis sinensis]|uniref:ceramide glucosyltransferase n=1 Tax=Clonorchis sinensis TaxID=79923 RepID=A0A8T1MSE6_CLOSI|nr:Ceramide glucosyltransferase-B [Clonorchis sinensis]